MKKTFKIISLLFVLVFLLTACSNGSDTTSPATSTQSITSTSAEAATSASVGTTSNTMAESTSTTNTGNTMSATNAASTTVNDATTTTKAPTTTTKAPVTTTKAPTAATAAPTAATAAPTAATTVAPTTTTKAPATTTQAPTTTTMTPTTTTTSAQETGGEFYILYTEDKVDFSKAPKAEIINYPWNSNYTPYAYAQVIFKKDDGFYLFMYCKESNPKTEITQIGGNVYRDSAMEFFCDYYPAGKKYPEQLHYINLEMNSAGVYLAQYSKRPINTKTTFEVKGTKYADYWTLEAYIPLSMLKEIYGSNIEIGEGSFVECNFTKCGSGTDIPHWGTWQELGGSTPNFHQPDYFKSVEIRR